MGDYMRALHQRFEVPSHRVKYLEKQVHKAHKKLSGKLAKPERVVLLRLVDLEDALRDEVCLNSFFSGYRLASGIHRELEEIPPYSFAAEDEQRARKLAEKAREEE